jgi:hypothetical protein
MGHRYTLLLVAASLALSTSAAHSFCGFYVARGDAKLYNHASQVVLARDGDRTVMTMMSDFSGDPKEFAVVIPVPVVLEKSQVHIGDSTIVAHLDAFSAPRLVEYFDPSPCRQEAAKSVSALSFRGGRANEVAYQFDGVSVGVRIEARYTVGEYDILILSAKESGGLALWLTANGYRIPDAARPVLAAYIKQGMKFFVAKVNLKEQQKLGFQSLRPIAVAYESPKFMLPIRLGMANATGPQDLIVLALTRSGRVECVNYRTVKVATDQNVPEYVKDKFEPFYRAAFDQQAQKEGAVVFTEYAWDMGWCDPCASQPLSPQEQRELGAMWIDPAMAGGRPATSFVTRLHVRYDRAHFPEDLVFQETGDRTNWQARYVIHHPWQGDLECEGGAAYRAELRERRRHEAETLASLTGWDLHDIRTAMHVEDDWSRPVENMKWYQRLWGTSDASGSR